LFVKFFSVNIWPAINGKLMNKNNFQIFGGTQKYFGGTSGFRGTQVEKH
jgi:hypothetical protein